MTALLDTGILYAAYDRRDAWHERAVELITNETGELLVPAPTIPEVDHLIGSRLGTEAQMVFYRALIERAYSVVDLPHAQHERVLEINRRFKDLKLGFVDASVLALSEVLNIKRVATTDRRHFGAVQQFFSLTLIPATLFHT